MRGKRTAKRELGDIGENIACEFLNKKGVTIIPDILANAGGVAVSFCEWEQNRKNEHWKKEEIFTKQSSI